MIWQDMTMNEKQDLIIKYNDIKQQLLKLKGNRCHYNKEEYDQKVLELQQLYNNVLPQYKCDNCKTIFTLDLRKSKQVFKGDTDPIFCNVKCSGQYYANKQHNEMTQEQWLNRRYKISNTLKEKVPYLSQEVIQKKLDGTRRYWDTKSPEERSIINKRNAIKAKKTKQERYGDENYNNSIGISNTWQNKSKEQMRDRSIKSAETRLSNIASDGLHLDSSYELDFYEYFLHLGIKPEMNIPIKYTYKGKIKTTLIDFRIDNILYECKGSHILNGMYDSEKISIKTKLGIYNQNDVILITDTKGLDYCIKNKIKLIVLTIDLFKSNIDWNIIKQIINNGGMNK